MENALDKVVNGYLPGLGLKLSEEQIEQCNNAAVEVREHTGERLMQRSPATYVKVAMMLTDGCGVRDIVAKCGVSNNTVAAIRKEIEGSQMCSAWKRKTRTTVKSSASAAIDLIHEKLHDPDVLKKLSMKDATAALQQIMAVGDKIGFDDEKKPFEKGDEDATEVIGKNYLDAAGSKPPPAK